MAAESGTSGIFDIRRGERITINQLAELVREKDIKFGEIFTHLGDDDGIRESAPSQATVFAGTR